MSILGNVGDSFFSFLSQRANLIPNDGQVNWNPPDINNLLTDGDIFLTPFILLAVVIFFFRKWSRKPTVSSQEAIDFIENESDSKNDPR